MGASEWQYFVPYQEDIEKGLQDLRSDVFSKGQYYPFGVEAKRHDFKSIDELISYSREAGTHSILDMTHVDSTSDFGVVSPLSTQELNETFGTDKPTHEMVVANAQKTWNLRRRWRGFYTIVYKDGLPDEIYFSGFSGD